MRDPDRALYRGLQRRNPRALEELIQQYSRRLLDLIRRILGGLGTLEDAEEVLADTFTIVWFEIEDYDPKRAPFSTWVWMRAKYAALDHRRKLRRRRDTVPLLEGRRPPRPKDIPIVQADRWDLHQTLSNLPELERELVYRRYFLQESLREIAEQVGLTIHAVRNRLWRTRKRLQETIEAQSETTPAPTEEKEAPVDPPKPIEPAREDALPDQRGLWWF